MFQKESSFQSLSFDLRENEPVVKMHFRTNGFALILILTRRKKTTWKLPIVSILLFDVFQCL